MHEHAPNRDEDATTGGSFDSPKLAISVREKAQDLAEANLPSQSVEELAEKASQGCTAAFAELFSQFHPRLTRFLEARHQQSASEAEDVAQEALIKAWRSISTFDTRFQFSTWIYSIAVRTSVDAWRKQKKLSRQPLATSEEPVDSSDQSCELDEAHNSNVWKLAQALLPADHYSALWLRYGEDLPVKEIARILNKTTVGVRVALHRARAKLSQELSQDR